MGSKPDRSWRVRAALDGKSVYFAFARDAIEPDQTSAFMEHAKLASDSPLL